MARNKMFKRRYVIEIKGTTTNNFMIKLIDSFIGNTFLAIANQFVSVKILTMTAEDISTHKASRETFKCGNCGATKYTEGSTCLLCAEEGGESNA